MILPWTLTGYQDDNAGSMRVNGTSNSGMSYRVVAGTTYYSEWGDFWPSEPPKTSKQRPIIRVAGIPVGYAGWRTIRSKRPARV